MDLSQYAELFLAESREHLTACNQLLLEWEKHPSGLAPVGGLFRAVHTVKGMAATMGYARVTDLAHRMESLLDLLRRGAHPATDELLQLLFRARDALEHAVQLSVGGRGRGLAGREADDCAGRFSLRLASPLPADRLEAALTAVGDGEGVAGGGDEALGSGARVEPGAAGVLEGGGRSRHIRVALRRLDGLMDLIGELVTARGRLNQLAAERRDPAIDDLAIQVARLSSHLQAETIRARLTPAGRGV